MKGSTGWVENRYLPKKRYAEVRVDDFGKRSPLCEDNLVYFFGKRIPSDGLFHDCAGRIYAIRTNIAEIAPFVAYFCNTCPYGTTPPPL